MNTEMVLYDPEVAQRSMMLANETFYSRIYARLSSLMTVISILTGFGYQDQGKKCIFKNNCIAISLNTEKIIKELLLIFV